MRKNEQSKHVYFHPFVALAGVTAMLFFSLLCGSCRQGGEEKVVAPWGEVIETPSSKTPLPSSSSFTLEDIVEGGELIMLTISGPETYYDDHGRKMGLHYLLCEKFAQTLGVGLRVEICRDTTEMLDKLSKGQADVIAFPLLSSSMTASDSLFRCGFSDDTHSWAVARGNQALAEALEKWYTPDLLKTTKEEEQRILAAPRVRRRVFSPVLNRSGGVISKYDHLFQKYAPTARCDWRLMAAQCYQESCFDPEAYSWAGARGLMQIMPKTAQQLGLAADRINEPEANVEAAARLMAQLDKQFADIPRASERLCFVLASYNGGSGHVRDAMALTKKAGANSHSWSEVEKRLLLLSQPQYYNDPVVKHGYIRSNETYNYVRKIQERYAQYCGLPVRSLPGNSQQVVPRKATKKHKYHV